MLMNEIALLLGPRTGKIAIEFRLIPPAKVNSMTLIIGLDHRNTVGVAVYGPSWLRRRATVSLSTFALSALGW